MDMGCRTIGCIFLLEPLSLSLLEGAIERPVRWGKEVVKFNQPGARGSLHRVRGPCAIQRLDALQLVAEVGPALDPDEKAPASVRRNGHPQGHTAFTDCTVACVSHINTARRVHSDTRRPIEPRGA